MTSAAAGVPDNDFRRLDSSRTDFDKVQTPRTNTVDARGYGRAAESTEWAITWATSPAHRAG